MEKNCLEYRVIIQGQYTNDDGLEIDMGALTAAEALYELPLVRCPDCQGDLVSGETRGYGPRTLQCVGLPLGGRPTNPLRDVRVPSPDIDLSRGGLVTSHVEISVTVLVSCLLNGIPAPPHEPKRLTES